MVVLDQYAIRKAHAVVVAAPHAHGVLVQQPPAGQRLARVDEGRARTGHGVGVRPRRGGNAGEALREVERRPLGAQDGRQTPRYGRDTLARLDPRAVLRLGGAIERIVHLPEDREGNGGACDDARLLRDHRRVPTEVVGKEAGRGIGGGLVLGERVLDELNGAVPAVELHRIAPR